MLLPNYYQNCKGINLWPHQILAWSEWSWCASLNSIEVGLLSHFSNKIIIIKSLNNLTGGRERSRLVLSSLVPVLEELGTTEIPLQTQLYPLNRRVDYLTQDRRHCAPSLDLDLVPHHFHHLYHLFLDLQTSQIYFSVFIRWWNFKTVKH